MDKRYQIFISSTFADLEEERKAIMEAILGLDCFPTGMEMFPASDSEQFDYIKTIIDESDYYVLVIAGRYGSEADDGKSYTQKEFEYAREKGIPVLVFVMKDIDSIPVNKTDQDEKKKKKLIKFRDLAMQNRLARYWDDYKDLKYEVQTSLAKTFKMSPRTGWIKGNIQNNEQLLQQLNTTRQEYDQLKMEVEEYRTQAVNNSIEETLSSGEEKTKIKCKLDEENSIFELTWNDIFTALGGAIYSSGSLMHHRAKDSLESKISEMINGNDEYVEVEVSETDIVRVQAQLEKLNLIKKPQGRSGFVFTERGKEAFYNQIIEKKDN